MSDWRYLIVVAAGAIMVWHQAFSQFETPLKVDQDQRYPILNEVEIKDLTSDSVYRLGRLVYLLIFLVVYFIGLQVWDVVESISSQDATSVESGAQGPVPGEPEALWLDREGFGRPIYIAGALISLLSVGALAKYERSLRAFAHRRAGIPDNIYRVTGRLSRVPYADIAQSHPSRRVIKFNTRLKELERQKDPDRTGPDKNLVERIRQDLTAIDVLAPAVIEDQYSRTWRLERVRLLDKLKERQREEMHTLATEMGALTGDEDAFYRFSMSTERIKNNLQALFAVLYLKDADSKFESANAPTMSVIQGIRGGTLDYAVSSVVLSILATLFLGAFVTFFIGFLFYDVALGQMCPTLRRCDPRHLSFVGDRSLRMYLEVAAVLSTAAIVTAARRRSMVEARNWEDWNFNQPPIPRLVRAALAPASLAALAIGVVIYLEAIYDNYAPGVSPFATFDTGALLIANVPFLLVAAITGFLTSLCVLVIADMHKRLKWYKSLFVSLVFALLIFLSALVVFVIVYRFNMAWTLRDALDYLLLSAIFLGAFAIFIERSEAPARVPLVVPA